MNPLNLAVLVAAAAGGSLAAIALSLPVPLLTGPALVTSALVVAGAPIHFPNTLRDIVFLIAGVAIGAGVSRDSLAAIATWPAAFLILFVALLAMIAAGRWQLMRMTRTDPASALLAATPGHLSFVIALSELVAGDTRRIMVVQSVRLLSLTLLVPLAARLAGIETGLGLSPPGMSAPAEMTVAQTALSSAAALALVPMVRLVRLPAPVLLSGMIVGAAARLTGLAPGGLSHFISFPVLALIGALIGSRFAGITIADLRMSGLAGLTLTAIVGAISAAAAWAASRLVGMPVLHVLIAFAPGGLETMAVLGAAVGANPGFVAAAHVGRLVVLSFLVPALMARIRPAA